MPDDVIRAKTCPRCGIAFGCGPGTGARGASCWCQDLPPALPLASGTGCLCPRCLAQAIQRMAEARGA
jgi:hypothetical protein